MDFTLHACPTCNRNSVGWAFFPHTQDYLRCSLGHVWHYEVSLRVLEADESDCAGYVADGSCIHSDCATRYGF